MENKGKTKSLAYIWLSGLVFVDRNFAKKVDEVGVDAVMENCPYDDLTEEEKQSFVQFMSIPALRVVVQDWWKAYDLARQNGDLMRAESGDDPWHPYPY